MEKAREGEFEEGRGAALKDTTKEDKRVERKEPEANIEGVSEG